MVQELRIAVPSTISVIGVHGTTISLIVSGSLGLLFLVAMPGAPSIVLAPSSDAGASGFS